MLKSTHETTEKTFTKKSICLMVFFCILKSIISGDDSVAAAATVSGHQLNSFACKREMKMELLTGQIKMQI